MYKFFSFPLLLICSMCFKLQAQCTSCITPESYSPQYCHTDSAFAGFCAAFNEGEKYFYLYVGRKEKRLPYGAGDQAYFQQLSRDNSLKLTAEGLVFVQNALAKWALESRKLGYSFSPSGLGVKIVREGDGDLPKEGESIRVHYAGYLEDGTKFDSSYDRNQPIEFPLGLGRVIKGWDEGIATLKKGTKAFLYIPFNLAYGEAGQGPIPPKATLIFQVELLP